MTFRLQRSPFQSSAHSTPLRCPLLRQPLLRSALLHCPDAHTALPVCSVHSRPPRHRRGACGCPCGSAPSRRSSSRASRVRRSFARLYTFSPIPEDPGSQIRNLPAPTRFDSQYLRSSPRLAALVSRRSGGAAAVATANLVRRDSVLPHRLRFHRPTRRSGPVTRLARPFLARRPTYKPPVDAPRPSSLFS